jgi:hypothetical protein
MPETLRFKQKFPCLAQIQVSTNRVPWGLDGASMGKTIFICVYMGKNSLKIVFSTRNNWPISIKLDINHPCIKKIEGCLNKGPDHLQKGSNCKNRVKS